MDTNTTTKIPFAKLPFIKQYDETDIMAPFLTTTGQDINIDFMYIDGKQYNCFYVVTNIYGFTLFQWIVKYRPRLFKRVLDYIKSTKTDIELKNILNYRNAKGWTAVMLAASNSHKNTSKKILQMLIDAGANVNLQDTGGFTALMWCVNNINTKISNKISEKPIQMLIDAGADVNIQDEFGSTVLMILSCCLRKKLSEIILKMLIDAGADVNIRDYDGKSTLDQLIPFENYPAEDSKMVNILIKAGADYSKHTNNVTIKKYEKNKETKRLKQENEQLKKDNALLQAQVDYQPDGPGFYDALNDFNSHASSS